MANLRKCIGSTRFGIEPHEAAVTDFPVQPSQKDGLGRMCKPHWNAYTTALRKAAAAAKADAATATSDATTPEPVQTKSSRPKANEPAPFSETTEGGTE